MENEGGAFRFTGGIESITDSSTLWVKGEDLTMPVSLKNTKCWLLPLPSGNLRPSGLAGIEGVPEAPEQINWNRFSTLSEGTKVFIGGKIKNENDRLNFCSTKENPLMVIFYNCPDTELTSAIIRASRTRNDYWNSITPISLVIGALALIYIAASFLNRPAFRMTIITALAAIFIPILPLFPPGLLFTALYRRMTWQARRYRAYWDLARLPMRYLQTDQENGILSTGEKYGFVKHNNPPPESAQAEIPFLIPELTKGEKTSLYLFGVLAEDSSLPEKSIDPFVSFGILPDSPKRMVRRYAIMAYTLELFAWIILFLGIGVNLIFVSLILSQLR